ncbi:hypothetical protein M404DRAFT_125521 [Pisolithus tinctorius Marx 270]|uniref:Uncharacterized protein n=1 Tax=Pisolithus tinctorius Marx 270 TaxID=870435 RepID=A0A0C3KR63_PISTI|nr:hypothetical protein M404DRAFT_125521 [Pisolithus tinctorius Marx 270]
MSSRSSSHTTSGPPPVPQVPGSTQPSKNTRSSRFALEDIIDNPDAETAKYYLDQFYTVQGKPATPKHISHALFCILQAKGVSNTLCSAIRATAYLVRDLTTSAIANSVVKEVSSKIESSVVVAITPQVAKIWSAADNLEKTGKNLETLGEDLAKKSDMTQMPPTPHPSPYRDALMATTVNPNHIPLGKCFTSEHTKAHSTIKERQLLIDPNSSHPVLDSTTMRENIINAIKQALDATDQVDGPEIQLKSITRLCNNSILLKLNSQEAVKWIKETKIKETFLASLGGMVRIKDRHYNLVILFLPISTDIENPDTLRNMENENNIPTSSITQIKWIKDPSKCAPNQQVAHALASLASLETANQLLRHSLYWGLDRLRPHKDKKELVHCLKC